MRDVKLKLLIVVSIACLVLGASVSARSIVRSSDEYPPPGCLFVSSEPFPVAPVNFGSTQILSISMRNSISGNTLSMEDLGSASFTVDSFFDVFTEISIAGGPPVNVKLNGQVDMRVTRSPDTPQGATTSTFDTEIVALSLTGDVGGTPILIQVSPVQPSQGQTTLTKLGAGNFAVDSFFDVFTELSVDGGRPTEADRPIRLQSSGGQVGEFYVAVGGSESQWNQLIPTPSSSGGDGWVNPQTGEQWLPYPQDPDDLETDNNGNIEDWPTFWNEWWYDDPYDPDRIKKISLSFDYAQTDNQLPGGYAIIVVNWSTTDWSLNPPAGTDSSQVIPLTDFDPVNPSVAWVGRTEITRLELDTNPSGHFSLQDYQLPIPYNPEWVSIDVRGYNFSIINGQLTHECLPDPDLPPVIEQLDWIGSASSTPNSSWGRITLSHDLAAGVYYFNLSIGDGSGGSQQVITDLSFETPGGPQTLAAYLDFGVPHGTNVSSLQYGYSFSNVMGTVAPVISSTTLVPNLSFQIGGMKGKDTGSPGTANADPDDDVNGVATNDPNSGVIPDKDKFVNQPQKPNYCAPGAMSNSLKYLQARGTIPASVPTSISDLAGVLGTTDEGTPADGWYLKKATRYKKHVTTRTIEAPLTVAKVLELIKELKDGQDIEMELNGHVEVLVGMRWNPDGTVDLDLADDNQTDDKSDPVHTSSLRVDAEGNQKVDGMKLVRFIIECPKKTAEVCDPYFSLNTANEWLVTLEGGNTHTSIKPMTQGEWDTYMGVWRNPENLEDQANPYPETVFLPPELHVYEGDGNPDDPDGLPDDGGLKMGWGPQGPALPPSPNNNYATAYKVEYGVDPDFSNCIITVAVTAPIGIAQVSLGLETPPLGSGNIRSWYWNCGVGPGFPIQSGVPTTITIDTSIVGTTAATPTATSFTNASGPVPAPLFDITNVMWILVDENATWMGAPAGAQPPGGPLMNMWNYWHWLMVSPKTTLSKALITKHSQGPIVIDLESGEDPDVPLFWGWDELSDYHVGPIAADDWICEDDRPVTDFHWWGSFPGWREPYPPCHPVAFHIGIWTDVPAVTGDPESYSHPDKLVWEHICENYVWNFAGYDRDPRNFDMHDPTGGTDPGGNGIPGDDPSSEPNDSCFQYNQLLDGDDWFYQDTEGEPNRIYWLSIAPIWDTECDHEWGWKTRPKFFMDNAVSIQEVTTTTTNADGTTTTTIAWPPVLGSQWSNGVPLQIPAYNPQFPNHGDSISWDLAFEISTNEDIIEDDPIDGDIGGPNGPGPDGVVNIFDLRIIALNWLRVAPLIP